MPAVPTASSSGSVSLTGNVNENLAQVGGNTVTVGQPGQQAIALMDGNSSNLAEVDASGSIQARPFGASGAILFPNAATIADALAYPTVTQIEAIAGLSNGQTIDIARVANVFKGVQANASGDTAVWTPAAGKKFRLQGFRIQIGGDATISPAATVTFVLRDNVTAIAFTKIVIYVPVAVTPGEVYQSPWLFIPNGGILSAAANNVLNMNLSAALAAGNVQVATMGTEE